MEKRSIKKAVLATCMTLACCMAAAQADTLENLCIPNFFHNWCDENPTTTAVHDGLECILLQRGVASEVYEADFTTTPYIMRGVRRYEVAVQMRPDTMLHVTGIAFGRTGFRLLEYNATDLPLYDSATVSNMECHFNVYDSNLSLVATKAVRYTDIYPALYFPLIHEAWGSASFYVGYDALYEVFFDTVLDMTGPFYISETITLDDNTPCYADIYSYMEFHLTTPNPMMTGPFRLPDSVCFYRDTLVTGRWTEKTTVSHFSPIIFPIIRNDGDTCPQVRNVEWYKGNSTQFFMRWERGTNHYDWQVSYGPAGTAPDDGTMLTFNQPMSSLITVDPDSHYVAYVRARCRFDRDEWGPWSAPVDIHLNANDIETADSGVPVTLSPNPATASVTVACGEPMQSVELLDLDGRILLEQQPSGSSTTTLDTSTIPTGTYLLRIHTPQGTAVKKLVVRR